VANIQYLFTAVAFSMGKPFRKSIRTNYLLCGFMLFSLAYSMYLILGPDSWSAEKLSVN
jgi:hypothetical protein